MPQLARALGEFQRLLHEDPEHSGAGHAEARALLVHALLVPIDSFEQSSREPQGKLQRSPMMYLVVKIAPQDEAYRVNYPSVEQVISASIKAVVRDCQDTSMPLGTVMAQCLNSNRAINAIALAGGNHHAA